MYRQSCSYTFSCPCSSSLFFFSITRPPPSSTLFPYTTLFRSGGSSSTRRRAFPSTAPGSARPRTASRRSPATFSRRLDRKSTRLNSSHVEISYAVFCLKKKNTQRNRKHPDHGRAPTRLLREAL